MDMLPVPVLWTAPPLFGTWLLLMVTPVTLRLLAVL